MHTYTIACTHTQTNKYTVLYVPGLLLVLTKSWLCLRSSASLDRGGIAAAAAAAAELASAAASWSLCKSCKRVHVCVCGF
jgi:uncharacterized membrane protein